MFLAGQTRDWDVVEIRIAEEARPVEKGAAHRFRDEMDRFDRAGRLLLNLEHLKHVEHFDQGDAAGTGRWHGNDIVTEDRPPNRRAFLCLIGRQIRLGDQTAIRRYILGDTVRNPAGVECVRTIVRNRRKTLREIGQHEAIIREPGPPPGLP